MNHSILFLELHLVNHFRVLKNLSDLFLSCLVSDGLNAGDGGTGSVYSILQITNNTGHTSKTGTAGTTAGAVQNSTTDIIEDSLFVKPDRTFL